MQFASLRDTVLEMPVSDTNGLPSHHRASGGYRSWWRKHSATLSALAALAGACASARAPAPTLAQRYRLSGEEMQSCSWEADAAARSEDMELADRTQKAAAASLMECVRNLHERQSAAREALAERGRDLVARREREADEFQAKEKSRREAEIDQEAQAQFDRAVENRLREPKTLAIVVSAEICGLAEWRRDDLNEISTEKKYSAVGGSLNLMKMSALQSLLRALDEKLALTKSAMKTKRIAMRACSDSTVARLANCLTLQVVLPTSLMPVN